MTLSLTKRAMCLLAMSALLVLMFCFVANAAGNEVDLTYYPSLSKPLTSNAGNLAVQPDGKIIIFGLFHVVDGVPKVSIARLNSDGTLDTSFICSVSDFYVMDKVVTQSDGKILISGISITNTPKLSRYNSNGSPDGSFIPPFTEPSTANRAIVYAVQSDGKIFAATQSNNSGFTILYRLNSDGTVDNSFAPINFSQSQRLNDLLLLPGGQLLIAGSHPNGSIFRVDVNGNKDASFESPLLGNSQTTDAPAATSISRQSDGRIVFTGNFRSVNGITREGPSRLNADGTLDLLFAQSGFTYERVRVLSNDKIMVGATRRLNADGTLDNTFTPPASLSVVYYWGIDGSDRVLVSGKFTDGGPTYRFARLATDGSIDPTFNPTVRITGFANAIAVQSDGRSLVGGDFSQANGVIRSNLVRFNADGTLDPSFDAGPSFMTPKAIAVQANGKILVGGATQLVRLESNGTVDAGFTATVNSVNSITIQPDNKILIGGSFATVNGATHKLLARLNSDGTTDATFNPILSTSSISTIIVQSDNKIIIAGTFNGVSGVARSNIARLNSDGSVDTSFNAGSISPVTAVAVQPNGKYLIAATDTLKRFNVDGSVDDTFSTVFVVHYLGGARITGLVLQPDGSVVFGGYFYTINGYIHRNLSRANSVGLLDPGFLPNETTGVVNTLVAETGGRIMIGGSFTLVNSVERAGVARLNIAPFVGRVAFDYDGDGKADVSVYRPSNSVWYFSRSSDSVFAYQLFGTAGDIPAPADYDGDAKTDIAVFRPSSGDWRYLSSNTGLLVVKHWGQNGDVPRPSDFDGDGRADLIVYRPADNNWYRQSSIDGQLSQRYFGTAGDKPVIGDFDGDGKSDPAIFRPSTGVFWYMSSIDSVHRAIPWGTSTDIPDPADFDGDGKTDAAVYRPSTGFWYIYFSGTNTYSFTQFGISEDKPIAADYDGDGKADIAVYRPSTGTWYMLQSTGGFAAQQFGDSSDVPTPNSFVP